MRTELFTDTQIDLRRLIGHRYSLSSRGRIKACLNGMYNCITRKEANAFDAERHSGIKYESDSAKRKKTFSFRSCRYIDRQFRSRKYGIECIRRSTDDDGWLFTAVTGTRVKSSSQWTTARVTIMLGGRVLHDSRHRRAIRESGTAAGIIEPDCMHYRSLSFAMTSTAINIDGNSCTSHACALNTSVTS